MHSGELQNYKSEISSIQKELKGLVDGYLVKRGKTYYQKTANKEIGITKQPHLVRQLARKAYLQKRLKHLENNSLLIKKQATRWKTEEPVEIIRTLSPLYQSLPRKYFFYPSVEDIDNRSCETVSFHPESLTFSTTSGILVRSKSERIIADALDHSNISYQYEAALTLGQITKYPDFSIKRPVDGKLVLWEHLGLMDQESYQQSAIEKFSFYTRHGFFPFANLICTYESDMRDVAQVYKLIEAFLLSGSEK